MLKAKMGTLGAGALGVPKNVELAKYAKLAKLAKYAKLAKLASGIGWEVVGVG